MLNFKIKISLFILFLPLLILTQDLSIKKVDGLFSHYSSNTNGVAITVVKNDSIIYTKGYGMANLGYSIPMTTSTLLDIGSCAKTLTAFAVLLLEKEGKLSLEDDIKKYIPEFPDYGDTIKVKHLGTHTSGIREWIQLFHISGYQIDGDPIFHDHLLKMILNQRKLNFSPGDYFNYSNSNYVLLAEIITRVSGQAFSKFAKEHIFVPFKMENSFFYDDLNTVKKNEAARYFKEDTIFKQIQHFMPAPGAGGLYTTAKDMGSWLIHFSQFLESNSELKWKMEKQMKLNSGETISTTFGQYVDPYQGLYQLQHAGGGVGINSYQARFPNQNFAVFVSCNDYDCNAQYFALKIADIFLEEYMQSSKIQKPTTVKSDSIDLKPLERWAGYYWSEELNISRFIEWENGHLYYVRTNGNKSKLIPQSNGYLTFEGNTVESKFWFKQDDIDKKHMYFQFQNDPVNNFEEYVPLKLPIQELDLYIGTYYCAELETIYTISLTTEGLSANHLRKKPVLLSQVTHDLFTGNKTAFSQVQFIRDGDHAIIGFEVSSRNAKGILFKKIR